MFYTNPSAVKEPRKDGMSQSVASARNAGIPWALTNTLVFDSRDHLLRAADVEIAASKIVGVVSAGTSRAPAQIDARGSLCMPGLVDACVAPIHALTEDVLRRAVMHGVTTLACFTSDVFDDIPIAARIGQRVILFATFPDRWVGPGDGPRLHGVDVCVSEYERAVQTANTLTARVTVSPGIGSQLSSSPQLVLSLHELACQRGGRLAVQIDAGGEHAMQFRDAYGYSGVSLLRSLGVLDPHLLAFPAAPLTYHEYSMLHSSGVNVVGVSPKQGGNFSALTWMAAGTPLEVWLDARRGGSNTTRDAASYLVDALTWRGAHALGVYDVGHIAIDQYADLLLYDCPDAVHARPCAFDAAALIKLMTHQRPVAVLTGGEWSTSQICFAR